MQAGALLPPATPQAKVARQLVSRWHARWQAGGLDALRSAGPTGQAPRLSDANLAAIDQALRQGARAHGFDTDHWALARITSVVGVSFTRELRTTRSRDGATPRTVLVPTGA
jgi:transposase